MHNDKIEPRRLVAGSILVFLLCSVSFAEIIVSFEPQKVYPGRTLKIVVKTDQPETPVEAQLFDSTVKFYPKGGHFEALIGVPLEQAAGNYRLVIKGNDLGSLAVKNVKVSAYKFPVARFRLKPAKKKLLAADLIANEWAQVEAVLLREEDQKRWTGTFSPPVSGPVSMAFGTREFVNGRRRGQHRGVDLAVPAGTSVAAPNEGQVVFARELKAFGGTMVIDHGRGVHSLYFHLSKFLKTVGDSVGRSEAIALSGNSGISSGPHLHWGLSVHNRRVDPLQWVKYEF